MPKIRRTRIVNFNYNDGNYLIPDEIWDCGPDSGCTIYNFGNGQGKSTIDQASMQPILPRVRIQDRAIEDFFTKPSDHAFSVLEWSLDNSDMLLMTGIAMASGVSTDPDGDRTPRIKYYTFLSTYPENSDRIDTLCNLPLSSKDENGNFVPAAFEEVRNLSKKVSTLERYSSDDHIRWKERLAEFGIYQDEWQVIAEINRDEGGIGNYFKEIHTSDNLIDKVVLPRIVAKGRSDANKDEDTSIESMVIAYAREDMNLEKQISERQNLNNYVEDLSKVKDSAESLWNKNEEFTGSKAVFHGFLDALCAEKARLTGEREKVGEEIDRLNALKRHISYEKASSEYYRTGKIFQEASDKSEQAMTAVKTAEEAFSATKHRRDVIEYGIEAKEVRRLSLEIQAQEEAISAMENNTDIAATLNSLRFSAKQAILKELGEAMPEKDDLEGKLAALAQTLAEINSKIAELDKNIRNLDLQIATDNATKQSVIKANDDNVISLKMGIQRRLDGHYCEDELASWEARTQEDLQHVKKEINDKEFKVRDLEQQEETIPEGIRAAEKREDNLRSQQKDILDQIDKYTRRESNVQTICNRRGISFETRFTDGPKQYMDSQVVQQRALIKATEQKLSAVEYAITAIKQGTLHIPAEVLKFLDNNNIAYVSVEHYLQEQIHLRILSEQQVVDFLKKYPYAAFGIKIDSIEYEQLLKEAEKQDLLPSVLPVFTDEDIDNMLRGNSSTDMKLLSVFAQDYFSDKDSYTAKQESTRAAILDRLSSLQDEEAIMIEDATALGDFANDYTTTWLYDSEKEASRIEDDIKAAADTVEQMKTKARNIREELNKTRDELNDAKWHKREIDDKLVRYSELLKGLEKEHSLEEKISDSRGKHDTAVSEKGSYSNQKETNEKEKTVIESQISNIKTRISELQKNLLDVEGASEAEIIDGPWDELIAKYRKLSETQSADINTKKSYLESLITQRANAQRRCDRIENVLPDECENMDCTEELLAQAKKDVDAAEDSKDKASKVSAELNLSYGRAENAHKTSEKALTPYGGEPLPEDQVGADFERRIKDANDQISGCERKSSTIGASISDIEKLLSGAEAVMDNYGRPDIVPEVVLESNIREQYNRIKDKMDSLYGLVQREENALSNVFLNLAAKYTGVLEDGAVNSIKDMQAMLNLDTTGDRYYTIYERLGRSIELATKRIKQIDTDLSNHDQMKEDLVNQCVIQGNRLHTGLQYISSNTKVKIQGVRRQMVVFDIPKVVDENIAKATITTEIDNGLEGLKKVISADPNNMYNIEKAARKIVGNESLIRKYIGAEKIPVKVFKVDTIQENSSYRTWEVMHKNSGGQKTVIYFTIIFALMAYSRNSIGDISDNRGSVMFLDNPFGPMTSDHLVQPWFDIAKLYNVQLICFTAIKNIDVVKLFNNVIQLKIVQRKASHKCIVTHDGNADIEHGFYRTDRQAHMF